MNFLDLFAQKLREKREQKKITQRELAERLNMCTRTVIEIEKCKSNPKFETVALISEEMDISLDGIVFHDRAPQTVAKCVLDYFAGKSEEESQRYIDLCMSADKLKRCTGENKRADDCLSCGAASGLIFSPLAALVRTVGTTGISILFFLFVCIPDLFKGVLTDGVFNPASISLCNFRVNASCDKLLCKELMPLINFFGNIPACFGQMQNVITIYR